MSLEERFVGCYVFHTYDIILAQLDDFVDQQERVTVRKQFADTVDIHDRFSIRVIDRSLYIV